MSISGFFPPYNVKSTFGCRWGQTDAACRLLIKYSLQDQRSSAAGFAESYLPSESQSERCLIA